MVDMHMHSSCSDGTYPPAALMQRCREHGIDIVSLTDHDTTAGLDEAHEAAQSLGLQLINGIEFSCETDREVHILGYQFDHTDAAFLEMLHEQREERRLRTIKMVDKLRALGAEITYDEVMKETTGPTIGRPHIAAALVKKGFSPDLSTAFQQYLAHNAPAYVKRVKLSPEKAIKLILAAKGIPVLAHPLLTGLGNIRPLILELSSYGLMGIEAYYPAHTDGQCMEYESIAMQHKLLVTRGSDYHGEIHDIELGEERRGSSYLDKSIGVILNYRK